MKVLGYPFDFPDSEPDIDAIFNFREPFSVEHKRFEKEYSASRQRIADEIKRLELLNKNIDEQQQKLWYIFPEAYSAFNRGYRIS
jgi:hypothetical protein